MNNIPNPSEFRNLQEWAMAVYRDSQTSSDAVTYVNPQPVLLAHKTTDGEAEKAAVDGLLMFDPVLGAPVVSINGVWVEVSLV